MSLPLDNVSIAVGALAGGLIGAGLGYKKGYGDGVRDSKNGAYDKAMKRFKWNSFGELVLKKKYRKDDDKDGDE